MQCQGFGLGFAISFMAALRGRREGLATEWVPYSAMPVVGGFLLQLVVMVI